MAYDFHICRAGDGISLDEWRAHCAADPSLDLVGRIDTDTPSGTLSYQSEGLAIWNGDPSGDPYSFDLRRGRITFRPADPPAVRKAFEIAERLSASIEGDEGEIYHSPEEIE